MSRRNSHKYLSSGCLVKAARISSDDIPEFTPDLVLGPRASARSMEDVKSFDRMWFAMHPRKTRYYRMITKAETEDYDRQFGQRLGESTVIEVEQVKPGIRKRRAHMVIIGSRSDELMKMEP